MKAIFSTFASAAVIFLAQGCATGNSHAADSGVSGMVSISPGCPGPERKDKPCSKALVSKEIQLRDSEGKIVGKAITGDNGQFQIHAPAGTYSTHIIVDAFYPKCRDTVVSIEEGAMADLDLICDSGMRQRN